MSVDNFVKSEYSLLMTHQVVQTNNAGDYPYYGNVNNCWIDPLYLRQYESYIPYIQTLGQFTKGIPVKKKIYILVGYEKETNTQINISKAFDDQKLAEELQENLSKDESTQWVVHEVEVES
jgi:hypothetical protein